MTTYCPGFSQASVRCRHLATLWSSRAAQRFKKCYFGDYRFSEDLDFSGLDGVPVGDAMERLVNEACDVAVRLLDEYAPMEIFCERYTEREPHPGVRRLSPFGLDCPGRVTPRPVS